MSPRTGQHVAALGDDVRAGVALQQVLLDGEQLPRLLNDALDLVEIHQRLQRLGTVEDRPAVGEVVAHRGKPVTKLDELGRLSL